MSMGWTKKRNGKGIQKRETGTEKANGEGKGITGMRELFRHEGESRKKGGKNFGRMDKGNQSEEGMV
jgi:hypothetical protein